MSCVEHFGYYDGMEDFPEHRHTSCELLYLHEGETSIICGEKEFEIKSGMLYIIPSCVAHRTMIKSRDVYRRTLIFLNPWTYSRSYYSEPIYNLLMGFSVNEPIAVLDDFGCVDLLDKIRRELSADNLLSEDIIVSAVTEILAGIIRKANYIKNRSQSPGKLVYDVQRYIQENCGSQIMISDIADRFYISKYYLTHIFKEQTGMSPRKFLTCTRLSKVYNLLHEPDLKISDISDICGFTSPSDMTRKFREQYGITPMQFRRELNIKARKR
jgi:AraC-like DNA-binding protein